MKALKELLRNMVRYLTIAVLSFYVAVLLLPCIAVHRILEFAFPDLKGWDKQ